MSAASRTVWAEARTPLGVISLFLGFCEAIAGISAVRSDGWIQAMLSIFCVVFPLLIAGAFFLLLWKRSYVLYAPRDFPPEMPVQEFVRAMSFHRQREIALHDDAIRIAVQEMATEVVAGDVPDLVERTVSTARREADASSIVVDVSAFGARAEPVRFVATETSHVADLLDFIYFSIADAVAPFTIGREWELCDPVRGVRLPEVWALDESTSRDMRPLTAVGLRPGRRLAAIRPGQQIPRERSLAGQTDR